MLDAIINFFMKMYVNIIVWVGGGSVSMTEVANIVLDAQYYTRLTLSVIVLITLIVNVILLVKKIKKHMANPEVISVYEVD